MQKEKLIEEVRKYSYLYDLGDAKYSDSIKKDEAWKQISTTLKQPESNCKRIWFNLRESHRRAIKKNKTKSGQGATKSKKWTFEDEMSFLLPHYKERDTISSITNTSSFEECDEFFNLLNDGDSQSSTNATDLHVETPEFTAFAAERPEFSASESIPKPRKVANKKKAVESDSASAVLMKYLVDQKKNDKEDDVDEIDFFFRSIAATVRKFSEYNQAAIKSKIYNAVSTVELQEIAAKQKYAGYGNFDGGQAQNKENNYNYNQSKATTSNMEINAKSCATSASVYMETNSTLDENTQQ